MHDIRNLTISSTNPCLLVYLIDQSGSMNDKFGNASHAKAVEVTNAINDIIYEVGLRCIGSGGELKNRFEIAIVGYGKQEDAVQSGWEGQLSGKWVVSIKNIFEYPLSFMSILYKITGDADQKLFRLNCSFNFFFDKISKQSLKFNIYL